MALVPDLNLKYKLLFKEFLSEPGVLEELIQDLELVKQRNYSELSTKTGSTLDDVGQVDQKEKKVVVLPPKSPRGSPRRQEIAKPSSNVKLEQNNNLVYNLESFPPPPAEDPADELSDLEAKVPDKVETTTETDDLRLHIPTFYHPHVCVPVLSADFISSVQEYFSVQPDKLVSQETCGELALLCGLPFYLRRPLFWSINCQKISARAPIRSYGSSGGAISCKEFLSFWQSKAHLVENVPRFKKVFAVLTKFGERNYLVPQDFHLIVEDVLVNHPGLGFFRNENDATLFTSYLTVVTTSIFYSGQAWRRGRMYLYQMRNLKLDQMIDTVHSNSDIDAVQHFSYDQFYVVYVKFVELDEDRDMELDAGELSEYGDGGMLSARVVNRILEVNLTDSSRKKMGLSDFTVFLMSEVDKSNPQSLEYWFKILDLDNDGFLSLKELHTFHLDNVATLIALDLLHHFVRFDDLICQLVDSTWGRDSRILFSLPDLRKNPRMPHLLDAFLNLWKFISRDENSEFCVKKKMSDWDEYVIAQVNQMQN